jgi:endonuclease-3
MPRSPKIDWDGFFTAVTKITKSDTRPYVTRLAESSGDYGGTRAFKVLIATVLSLRTRDKASEVASEKIFKLGTTPEQIVKLPVETISEAIHAVTFYPRKAVQIHKIAEILLEKSGGKVPKTMEELDALPGVGRKTANLVLIEGFGKPGICVDTHVHRILNELGFVKTRNADETELVLREILPKKYWKKVNLLLVMLGMFHCPSGRGIQKDCLGLRRFLKSPAALQKHKLES